MVDVIEFLHRGMFCLLLDLIGWTWGSVYPSTEVCWKKIKYLRFTYLGFRSLQVNKLKAKKKKKKEVWRGEMNLLFSSMPDNRIVA